MAASTSRWMPVRLTLFPGKRGTLGLLCKYGERLVCVRYRYDEKSRKRYKTIELIVKEGDWIDRGVGCEGGQLVKSRILYQERELREAIKVKGGYWDRKMRAWILRWCNVRVLGLKDCVTE